MAQLIEALRYKPEGRGFDSRWCHWNFSLTQSCWPHYGPGVDSASNRNEYLEYFLRGKRGRCVGPIVLKSGSLNLLEPDLLVQACNGIALHNIQGVKTIWYDSKILQTSGPNIWSKDTAQNARRGGAQRLDFKGPNSYSFTVSVVPYRNHYCISNVCICSCHITLIHKTQCVCVCV